MTLPKPIRVQRKRSKGWRLPENTVCVDRSGRWGNLFIVNPYVKPGSKSGAMYICLPTVEDAVECFSLMIDHQPEYKALIKLHLRGKNLACFCPLSSPCHADILLRVANED